ncbi:FG-GAP repeat domain-containing protein [Streptomyces sp. NPDC050421]|uniref:FG-GAP repeat domain-containing protein n=1 Tax=Streptomyces sp. NPDC050421 TaxID=3365613 RepID=UPI00379B4862
MRRPRSPQFGLQRRYFAGLLSLALPLATAITLTAPDQSSAKETQPSSGQSLIAPESRAFTLAASSGERVEILDQREEAVEVFANPDGTTTRRVYNTPVWTRYDRVWQKADATMVRHDDGTVGPTAPVFGLTFSGGGSGPLATMAKNDQTLALSWHSTLPEPVLDGDSALYKSVLPDVDLKITAEVDGFSEHLIVKTPAAAANPALASIHLGISTQGVTLDDDADGNLLAKDSTGAVVFSAPKPKMWEQPATAPDGQNTAAAKAAIEEETASPATAPVAVDVSGSTLTLTPDAALLANADQFPLVIDPRFTDGTRNKWAVVYSAEPGGTFVNGSGWNSSNPPDEPRVGYNGTGKTRSFFQMNTHGLEGSDIQDVTFAVRETHSWGCDEVAAGPTELWATNSLDTAPSWNNSSGWWADYLTQKSFAHSNANFCPGVLGVDYKSAPLTAKIQQAADGGWDNVTLGLKADPSYEGSTNSFKRFENDPVLEVKYNYKPEVKTHAAYEGEYVAGGDGNKAVPCGGLIGNSQLAMTAKLNDKDGGTVTPHFSVTTSTGTSVPVKQDTKVSSGESADAHTANALTSGSYKWKVYATDDEGTNSPTTAECTFTVDSTGPAGAVGVTINGTTMPDPNLKVQARTTAQLKLNHAATDLAGFCVAVEKVLSVSSTRCNGNQWVPVSADGHNAATTITPTGYPESRITVVAYDKAGNHSALDDTAETTLGTGPADFVYAPDKNPGTRGYHKHDLEGDLNGDGYADLLATDSDAELLFYAGDGSGKVASAKNAGTGGWRDSLIAHGGDYRGSNSKTASPDGYEDTVARLNDDKLYLYGGNGLGTPLYRHRNELTHPNVNSGTDWARTRQLITHGDIDQNEATDADGTQHAGGGDLITIECKTDVGANGSCADAELWLYSGITTSDGTANQTTPFDFIDEDSDPATPLNGPRRIGTGGWQNMRILAVGDQNDDGIQDILARNPADYTLNLYPGRRTDGVYSLGNPITKTNYGTGGWSQTNRPSLASPGNAEGTVTSKTYNDDGAVIPYREFQPKAGEHYGDIWATTAANPDTTITYVKADGTTGSTTCPSGCLLFYPGGKTTHGQPRLVGAAGWNTIPALH